MTSLVEERRQQLNELCARFGVKPLELFGSSADGTFDPERSALDFLIEFTDIPAQSYSECFSGM